MSRLSDAIARLKRNAPEVEGILSSLSRKGTDAIVSKAEEVVNQRGLMEQIMSTRFDRAESRGVSWAPDKKTGNQPLSGKGTLRNAAIAAVHGTFKLAGVVWNISKVGLRYAKAVNKKRPFMSNPDASELAPAARLAEQVIEQEVQKISR